MKIPSKIVAVLLILLAGWIAFEVLREVLRLYREADSNLKLGVMTAAGSAFAFVVNNAIQSSRERRSRLFEAKREAYGEFITSFTSFFQRHSQDQDVLQEEMVAAIQRLSTDILTWGSAGTVNAHNRYQRANVTETDDLMEIFTRTENFLRAIRKDLGHSDASLEAFALTKLFLRGDEHARFS